MERTLAVVKPDGVAKGLGGEIIRRLEAAGLKVVALKMVTLSKREAQEFYYVHQDKGFYDSLTSFISSGPCVAMVLEGEGAIARTRELMGATDPAQALPGTIRRDYGADVEHNMIHGSDGPEAAAFEIPFFFNTLELSPAS